ncbi:MAG TPA: DoxX family protein [Thermoanaerobaculia bacterium]
METMKRFEFTNTAVRESTATDAIQDFPPAMSIRTVSRAKAIYWAATGIVCSVMVFSAINFNLNDPLGPMKGGFAHLGFPNYFKIELTVAKILGVLALLIPNIPAKIKEFAYFGFAITLISASIAHFSSGDGVMFIIDPLMFFGVLTVSYLYLRKIKALRVSRKQGLASLDSRSSTNWAGSPAL